MSPQIFQQVRPEILDKIDYGINNLIDSRVAGPFYLILCRNVLIYHQVETTVIGNVAFYKKRLQLMNGA